MSIDDKKKALEEAKKFHDENSDKIQFYPNIPKTVIFPADWNKHLDYKTKEFDDADNPGEKKSVTYTIYKVWNPNAKDTKKLRLLSASAALNEQISDFLMMGVENEGWEGACIAQITKKQKGASYANWSVQGTKCDEDKLRELHIID